MTENLTTKEQFQSWIEQSMDEETVLFEWIVPENYPRQPGEDVAEAYRITANEEAASGIVIYAKYHGQWDCNPTTTRPLIKQLLLLEFNRNEDRDDTEDAIASYKKAGEISLGDQEKEVLEAIKSLDIYEYRNLSDEEIVNKHIALAKDLLELSDSYPAARLALSYQSSFMLQFHQGKRQQTEDAIAMLETFIAIAEGTK